MPLPPALSVARSLAVTFALSLALTAPAAAVPEQQRKVAGDPATRVLAISIDGLNPQAIRRLGRSGAPNLYRLKREGAATFNARTVLEQTVTLPNHTSMFTGRRVDAAKGGHGVTWDDNRPGTTVQAAAGHPVSSVFNVAHDAGLSTALFATKTKFSLYPRSWPAAISRTRISDLDDGRVVRQARTDLVRHDRALTFLHISLPDHAGHEHGFMSAKYVAAVAQTDRLIGILLRAVDTHVDLAAELVIVLTADHGGIGPGHSDRTRLGNYRIPFVAWGAGVDKGHLYDMNPSYQDPGTGRPSYAGTQPIRNGDLANLATDLLGLGPVPGSLFDADQSLTVTD